MNAPKEGIELLVGAYELLPLAAIAPSETHIQRLRRARYSMETLADLRISISRLGVQQPVVVRKLEAMRGMAIYELVAGERRFRAAGQAGLAHIPAVIRLLSDEEVLEVQLVENLQREDLHPLEEAAGYEELMKVAKLKKEELGERVGKSRSWVYSRLNLLKLPKEAQQALQSGVIDVSRALLVGSIADPARQAELLARALERDQGNNPAHSVRELRTEILKERRVFPLVGAPFPIDDGGLIAAAGACGPCPYRAGNCDPEAANPDVCTNVPCYERKVKAHGDRRRQEVLARGGKVLKGEAAREISPSVNTVYGHVDLDLVCDWDEFPEEAPALPKGVEIYDPEAASLQQVVAYREREEAWQPRTYRALLASETYSSVLIDDPKTKLLRELVPFKEAQLLLKKKGIDLPSYANRKRRELQRTAAPKPVDAAAAQRQADAELRKRAESELQDKVEAEIVQRLLKLVHEKWKGPMKRDDLELVAEYLQGDWDIGQKMVAIVGKRPSLASMNERDLGRLIVAVVALQMVEGQGLGALKATAKRLKIDPKAIEKDVRAELLRKETRK